MRSRWLGVHALDLLEHRALSQWLLPITMQTTQGMALAQALVEAMRRRKIELPALGTMERLSVAADLKLTRSLLGRRQRYRASRVT